MYVHMNPVYVRGAILYMGPVHWGHSVMGIRCTKQWNLSTEDTVMGISVQKYGSVPSK